MCESGIACEAHGTQRASPCEHALCISRESAQVDHTTGVQVQTYSRILICLWGVARVVQRWCQPRENFFTRSRFEVSRGLSAEWRGANVRSHQRACKSLIGIQSSTAGNQTALCLHHCGCGVWSMHCNTRLRAEGVGFESLQFVAEHDCDPKSNTVRTQQKWLCNSICSDALHVVLSC